LQGITLSLRPGNRNSHQLQLFNKGKLEHFYLFRPGKTLEQTSNLSLVDVLLVFRSTGPLDVYLNGREVAVMPGDVDQVRLHPLLWEDQDKALVHLIAGRNMLLVHSQMSETNPHWLFCGVLLALDGGLITDVAFE